MTNVNAQVNEMERRWPKARGELLLTPSYDALVPEYQRLWDGMTIRADKTSLLKVDVDILLRHASAYRDVAERTSLPWAVIGLIDLMEHGGGANSNLANGDPLTNYTKNEPAGRPQVGHPPPFTFVEAAVDALRFEKLTAVQQWVVTRVAYVFEGYNGFGYRSHGIYTPYLWSYSNWYTKGKYVADGKYDPNAVSKQSGAMPLMKTLFAMVPDANFVK